MGLFDQDIRSVLIERLRKQDESATIVEEMPLLRGRGRADVAFINGELHGFEIKSERDSLVRLGTQAEHYESSFEFITLVVARKHLSHARERVPKTWGLILAERGADGRVSLSEKREAKRNARINPAVFARMLWKRDCLKVLVKAGISVRHHAPVIELWKLIESLPLEMLRNEVRNALKLRQQKLGQLQIQYGDSRTIEPIASDRQALPHHP